MIRDVLIVGASVAGIGCANELRRCGFAGGITLVDGQPHLPYDRPPLSKAALSGGDTAPHFRFHEAEHYARTQLDLRLGSPASALDTTAHELTLRDGARLRADAIVIATGARARQFPSVHAAGPVHTLRDFDDAANLCAMLHAGLHLAIIGGGFIGAEVASSAAARGLHVTIVEADELPFLRVLGPEVGTRLAVLHRATGVELRCGTTVERIDQLASGKRRMELSAGPAIETDLVVAGLGALPNVEWLAGSGLAINDGVTCDAQGRTSAAGVFAAGDAAAWWDAASSRHERHEHWTAAREQSRIVAQAIVGAGEARWPDFVPYFWSDMHGKRVQMLGATRGADSVEVVFEDLAKGAFLAEYSSNGRLIGVVGCNAAARAMRYGPRLARGGAHV